MALCVLHKDGAIHADIKPENCLIREKESNTNKNGANNDEYQKKDNINYLYSSARKPVSPNVFINSSSILKLDTLNKLPKSHNCKSKFSGNLFNVSNFRIEEELINTFGLTGFRAEEYKLLLVSFF